MRKIQLWWQLSDKKLNTAFFSILKYYFRVLSKIPPFPPCWFWVPFCLENFIENFNHSDLLAYISTLCTVSYNIIRFLISAKQSSFKGEFPKISPELWSFEIIKCLSHDSWNRKETTWGFWRTTSEDTSLGGLQTTITGMLLQLEDFCAINLLH